MPHAHCLFILKTKLLAARHIDAVVWAEIPCPTQYPALHAIVCQRMIHDPCNTNADKPCLQKVGSIGVCYRRFPKEFNSATTIIGDGYPQYRRRGRFVAQRNGIQIDDSWVVPYNPHLLQLFDCHINVEVGWKAHAPSDVHNMFLLTGSCSQTVFQICLQVLFQSSR